MLPGVVPWPAEFAERYRQLGYWQEHTLGMLLQSASERFADRTALAFGKHGWSYGELQLRSDRLAAGLGQLGIGPTDRVVVQLPNVPEFFALCFALFKLGALPVFALPAHRRSEISYMCSFTEAVAYVIADTRQGFDYRALAQSVRAECPSLRSVIVVGDPGPFTPIEGLYLTPRATKVPKASDTALFQLSGGTTGLPKLIPRTHEDYSYSIRASAELCRLTSASTYLAVLPISHNFPLSSPGVFGTLFSGGKVVLSETSSPDVALPLIEEHRVTVTAVVPPLALMWAEAARNRRHDLSSLQVLQVGGARLGPEGATRVRDGLRCPLQQVFGMAEGLVNYTRLDDPWETVQHSQGRPLSPADEIRIVDDNGADVSAGNAGQLLTRGPYTIRGYYAAPQHNMAAFTEDGFYRTGDVVRATSEGNLVVEGRIKDLINRGGDKISAEELENHVLSHPAIRNAAAVSMPDGLLGERTCVFVVTRNQPLSLSQLKDYLRTRGLAEFKFPDRLEIVEALPLTSVGKISKTALRERLAQQLAMERRPLRENGIIGR